MSSFCFIVTEKCNWNCKYCDFPLIDSPKETNIEILSKHLPYISKIIKKLGGYAVHIDIAGGEVGLLPLDVLQYFFKTLDCKLVVSTNGKFLLNKYHLDPILRPHIKEIQWHVVDHPRSYKVHYDYNDDEIFINKGIVHNNADDMIDFIKINKHITFNYVEFEFPTHLKRKKDDDMYLDLYKKVLSFSNVTTDAKNIIFNRTKEDPKLRNLCKWFNQTVVTDLVNEEIMFCHRSQNVTIPLNKKNFKKRIHKFPRNIFPQDNIRCEACTRLYSGKMSGNEIETFFKTSKIKL